MKQAPIPKPRSKNSIYYLTINSNVIFDGSPESVEKAKVFEHAIREMFSEEHLFDYVKFTYPEFDNLAYIPQIDIHIAMEIQSNQASKNFIHSHCLISFLRHRSQLQMDYRKIKQDVKDKANLPHLPYLNSKLIRNLTTFEDLKNQFVEYGEKFALDIQEQS